MKNVEMNAVGFQNLFFQAKEQYSAFFEKHRDEQKLIHSSKMQRGSKLFLPRTWPQPSGLIKKSVHT
jgi:hypothetical protein